MADWYNALSVLEKIYFYVGCIASVFLVVQIIMMCISGFGADVDVDGDGLIDADADTGVSIFTTKSLTAFFAIGGWTGLLMCGIEGVSDWVAVVVSLAAGIVAMAVVVLFMKLMMKLQCNGLLEPDKLVGKTATVYVSVPPSREGRGKITLTAQGKYVELDAMTDEAERLKIDETVEIIAADNECMLVKKVKNNEEIKADEKSA